MISEKVEDALNEQINAELYSAYLYLSMESYFESVSLAGFANWMRIQTQEELMHAMKIYDFVIERDERVLLKAIEQPQNAWESPLAAFEAVYKHEQKVTGLINDLVNLAIEERDHATSTFLQWFVSEQIEEEKNACDIVGKLKLIGDSPQALFMMNDQMAQRVFTQPATEGGE
ncbi:MAG: ferritin [Planctomycetota bacterium]|jgi:ferritin